MDNTITQLQVKLEDLKKRLKSISAAQSNHTTLVAIKEYFAVVQEYLNALNETYTLHVDDCNNYSTQIQDLQSQIDQINIKLEDLGQPQDVDLTEIENTLEQLQTKLNTLTENSDTTIAQIVENISDIQTELGIINDNISNNSQEIEEINSSIGDMKTNITNLTTTQNNLTASQNNLSTNITNIDSRLTTIENNVDTITGGVDVSTLDSRIAELENFIGPIGYSQILEDLNITKTAMSWESRYFHFSCVPNTQVYAEFVFNFTLPKKDALTTDTKIQVFVGETEKQAYNAEPEQGMNEVHFSFIADVKNWSNTAKFRFTSSSTIIINRAEIRLFNYNIRDMHYQTDVNVSCFDGNIYITRYYGDHIKYQKFSSASDIEMGLLTNSYSLVQDDVVYNRLTYLPYSTTYKDSNNKSHFNAPTDVLIGEKSGQRCEYIKLMDDGIEMPDISSLVLTHSTEIVSGNLLMPYRAVIKDDRPGLMRFSSDSTFYELKPHVLPGPFIKVMFCKNNNLKTGDQVIVVNSNYIIGQKPDGNIYVMTSIYSSTNAKYVKIAKGLYATGYVQPNGDVNIYVEDLSHTMHKYKVSVDASTNELTCTYIQKIESCEWIYELLDNYVLKKINGSWLLEIIEY